MKMRVSLKSTRCKFHPKTPKNKATFHGETRERTRLYLRRRTLLEKENHLALLGGWKKLKQND